MNKMRIATIAWAVAMSAGLMAQTPSWDREKYPDYDPVPRLDKSQLQRMKARVKKEASEGKTRPDHWNNALSNAFPPVMNQSAGSCGSASRIYYMFAHEMNAARWADGSLAENIYPTHFTWLLTWTPGGQGKEVMAQLNGIPNSEVYGGYTYSETFGYQDCDDGQGNYGWMQGYDKWFHAMHNRITGSSNFPAVNTEEGRELVKNYLWNHCGDETYSTGGIVGVGVASGLTDGTIPKTAANTAAGVVGMKYVKHWGASVDHALTIVGYDDRIEFDLDGNGKYGEKEKDEVGAWIIVNSWGAGWQNKGFIYCPYAEARPTATASDYWGPEYYTPRRDYRPLRTLKVKMDYSHRSEIALYVGVAKDPNATKPDKETWLCHFYYSGLGKGFTPSASNPDPAIPMLGKWADGELHTEPMEFGYDLTDIVAEYESGQSLKYFFRVETRSWAKGSGKIYAASILDYTLDPEGIETPFDIDEEGVSIANAGKKTTITTMARGESVPTPRNLTLAETQLSWQAPTTAPYPISGYKVYQDGTLFTSTDAETLSATVPATGTFTVTAVYAAADKAIESKPSAPILAGAAANSADNTVLSVTDGQFTIPSFVSGSAQAYTIEFWMKPTDFAAKCFGLKASSGKLLFYVNAQKRVVIGFDGGDFTTSTTALNADAWQHIAIVVSGSAMKVYRTFVRAGSVKSDALISWSSQWSNSGLSGSNDLIFGRTEGTGSSNSDYKTVVDAPWTGMIDEIRIWDYARTQAEIKATFSDAYVLPANYAHLTHCYKMDTRQKTDGSLVLIDSRGGHDFTPSKGDYETSVIPADETTLNPYYNMTHNAKFSVSVASPKIGQAVTLMDESSPSTSKWEWTITGADIATSSVSRPVVVFKEEGEQTITLTTTNLKGETASTSKTVTVGAATAPVANFTVPEGPFAAGDHISFLNTSTPLDEATFTWTLEGAETETLHTVNAAASYSHFGTYTVRLEAETPAGKHSVEKQIEIVKVAPQAAFTLQNNVALVGEPINLIDNSKYNPEKWSWTIANSDHTYLANAQSGSIKLNTPGIYDVTLTATNDKGSSTIKRQRAITVCNADGQTGLNFDGTDDEVVAPSPFPVRVRNLSIDWWMYPGKISDTSCKIGDTQRTFMLTTGTDHAMTVYVGGKSAKSLVGYVVENQWHHYCVTYSSDGTVNFYRDGIRYCEPVQPGTSTTKWSAFRLGGADAPMNAIVDEMRVWSIALTQDQLREVANGPIEDVASKSSLLLYYDFNQSSGDVIDRSANNYDGVRNNFGPDGDAWANSKGIFFLNFTSEVEDVTSKYLKNYAAPFRTTTGFVNGTTRFKKLGSPWVQENSVVNDGITTEFHVDANKENYLTLSTSWDSFASEVKNLKLYQSAELPAGAYEFYALQGNWEWKPAGTKTVVSTGTGLPDWNDLETDALASSYCGLSCKFTLFEPTAVNLGLVSNQSGQTCHAINYFVLMRSPVDELEVGELVDGVRDIRRTELNATPLLQATGARGYINVTVTEPQFVEIRDLTGKLVWRSFVAQRATVPLRRALYLVNRQKVLVR